jgi:hypothetical protein
MYFKYLQALTFLLIFAAPFLALAHGAGAYYETTVGDYIADVGFSTPAPEEEESVIFDFQLRGINTTSISGSDAEFTDVWVRIESEGKTVLATGIYNADFGGPRLSYLFPGEGAYTIYVRYENSSETLAEVSFPMTVVPASGSQKDVGSVLYALTGIVGAIVGFLLAILFKKFIRF